MQLSRFLHSLIAMCMISCRTYYYYMTRSLRKKMLVQVMIVLIKLHILDTKKIPKDLYHLKLVMSRIVCLSHKEDVDGISSAALIKAAFKTKSVIILVDYANIILNLQKLALSSATERRIDRFFI